MKCIHCLCYEYLVSTFRFANILVFKVDRDKWHKKGEGYSFFAFKSNRITPPCIVTLKKKYALPLQVFMSVLIDLFMM